MADIITPYTDIYQLFLSKITDDFFMELTLEETIARQRELLESALPWFEFPRFNINARNDEGFESELSIEEKNIIATYMIVEWLSQQLATVELVRMKYSGVK